jgi:hypothetical protein
MRPALLFIAACLPLAAAFAQQAAPQREPAGDPRHNQKIERIVTEDAGNRIEEVRVGGQTQSVTVQPKADVPAYEIQPNDLARSRPGDHRDGLSGANGQRVWNIFRF